MRQVLVLMTDPGPSTEEDKVAKARRIIQDALRRAEEDREGKAAARSAPGLHVDKFFGTKLPPVCASLGCYLTDDGKRFYCVNSACQKHKKRDTKHTRRGNPEKARFAYFHCPRCDSRSIEMHILHNSYSCRACKYVWRR